MQPIAELLGFFFEHLVTIFVLVVLLQLSFCYAIQTIADKQEVPHSWLAWVPLLQIHPVLRAGGESTPSFLMLLAAGIAAIIVGAIIGPLGTVLALAWGAWMLFYFGQVFWNTAENRHVSGWVGLLALVPVINVVAYPYIAFHDGPVAPSRLGLLLGLIFIVLPAYPEARKARELAEIGRQIGPMAAAAEQGDEAGMRRLILESLQKVQHMEGLESSDGDLRGNLRALMQLTADLEDDEDGADAVGSHASAAEPHQLRSVSPLFECPEGTRERGAAPPQGFERWCERPGPGPDGIRHGGYASWHLNARMHETGIYVDGEREGVWTRWNERARLQTQAEFRRGVQHGFQIDWDESGNRRRELRFAQGEPVGR